MQQPRNCNSALPSSLYRRCCWCQLVSFNVELTEVQHHKKISLQPLLLLCPNASLSPSHATVVQHGDTRCCHTQLGHPQLPVAAASCRCYLQLSYTSNITWLYLQVASHPQCLSQHPALQPDTLPPSALPFSLNFQQRFSLLLGRQCVVSTQLDSHGDLVLSASHSGKVALHDFAMLRERSRNAV